MSEIVLIDDEVAQWEQLLKDFESLPRVQRNRTFMQIGGYPHYENVCIQYPKAEVL